MSDLRQAAQQALDAWDDPMGMKDLCVAMAALRTALEQQQAEPVQEPDCVPSATESADSSRRRAALQQDQALKQQAEPVHGDIRALKYRIHELEGEVMGYKRMLDVAEAASQPQQQAEPVAPLRTDK